MPGNSRFVLRHIQKEQCMKIFESQSNNNSAAAHQIADMAIKDAWIEVNGFRMRYLTGGDGPPLVLLNGHGEDSRSWRWVLPSLARTNRVYALELPGYGESAKHSMRSTPPSFYSDALAGFLDVLGLERVALVGNSDGGLTVLRFALAAPDRVTALVLVDSAGLGREINPALIALTLPGIGDAAVAWCSTPLGATQWVTMFASLVFLHPLLAPAEWVAHQYRLALTPGHLHGAVLACSSGQVGLMGQREVYLDELPRLTMPTLVVWGANDMVIPSFQAINAAARLKNGRLVMIPNCGHEPQVQCPDEFIAAVGPFLAEHSVT
jgi:pimeloyl-ACP methyl ester carboxylesterase